MGTSPFELPAASNGRRPVRLQMPIGSDTEGTKLRMASFVLPAPAPERLLDHRDPSSIEPGQSPEG